MPEEKSFVYHGNELHLQLDDDAKNDNDEKRKQFQGREWVEMKGEGNGTKKKNEECVFEHPAHTENVRTAYFKIKNKSLLENQIISKNY